MVWCACRSNYLGRMMAPTRRECSSPRASSNPVYSEPLLRRVAWFDRLTTSWPVSGDSLSGKKLERHSFKAASSLECNSYEKRARKPFRMRTYKIIGLKVLWNVHLQKKGVGGG